MSELKKVLILRFSSIGDIVLCSPVARCIKQQLKDVEVHFLTKGKFVSLVDQNRHVDKVWSFDKEITEVAKRLKNERYDLIIDLHKNLRSFRLIKKLNVPSLSFDKVNFAKWLRVYTPINILPKTHLVDRYFEALQSIGVKNDNKGLDFFYKVDQDALLTRLGLILNEFRVIVLGATYETKRVPIHLIQALMKNQKDKYVLIGGSDISDRAKVLAEEFPQIVNLVNSLSIQESACIMDCSNGVVTGDTGMMHIAAALKKPIISVWGSTHHDLGMYPYYGDENDNLNQSLVNSNISCSPCSKIGKSVCPKGHFKCMVDLKTEDLLSAIENQKKHNQKTLS